MRRRHQTVAIITAGTYLVAVLAACGSLGERWSADPAPQSSTPGAPTTDAAPVGEATDGDRLGGSETGFTIEVTGDWVEVDIKSGELVEAVDAVGFSGDADLVRSAVEELEGIPGVVFAFEFGPQIDLLDEFVTNLNGYCTPLPIVANLRVLARLNERTLKMIGATDIESSESTAGSTAALRTTYQLPTDGPQLVGLQYLFANADDDMCSLTFTTTVQDDDLDRFDRIAASLQLT